MNVDFTSDQLALQDGIRKVAARFTEEYWVEKDEARAFPWEFHQALAEGDWLGICIPEEYGGGGLGVTEASIVVQEIAASGACMNGASIAHTTMFSLLPIIKHGTPQQKERFLPRVASGDLHLAFAVTEPDAGTDTGRTSTFARKVDGGYLVSGKKVWITKAQEAERLLLLTRSVPASEVKRKVDGLTLFFAQVDRAHVDIRPIRKMGRNATDSNEVFIDDLFVPDEDLIGEPGRGFYTLLDGLNPERILNAQEAIGIGRAALRRACDYARDRVVFDRPIGMNQGIQFPLAEALAQLDAAELHVLASGPPVRRRPAVRPGSQQRQVPGRGGRLLCRRSGGADPWWLRLRTGLPRGTVLPRGARPAPRSGEPGARARLPGRARPGPAEVLLRTSGSV